MKHTELIDAQYCPFCGMGNIRLYDFRHIIGGCYAQCNACKARGPTTETPEGAELAWNLREPIKRKLKISNK